MIIAIMIIGGILIYNIELKITKLKGDVEFEAMRAYKYKTMVSQLKYDMIRMSRKSSENDEKLKEAYDKLEEENIEYQRIIDELRLREQCKQEEE